MAIGELVNLDNVAKAEMITIRLTARRDDLTAEQYHDITDEIMDALVALEEANPEHFADPGIASQAGPTPADRFVDIMALIRVDPDYVWVRIPELPECFSTGSALDGLVAVLAEGMKVCAMFATPEAKAMLVDARSRARTAPTSYDTRESLMARLRGLEAETDRPG